MALRPDAAATTAGQPNNLRLPGIVLGAGLGIVLGVGLGIVFGVGLGVMRTQREGPATG
jgi:hypothetical protein